MKKLLFLFVAVMLLISCSKESVGEYSGNFESHNEISQIVSVCDSIDSLNSRTFNVNQTETRGFWKWVKKILRCAVADAVGGLHGVLHGGVAGAAVGAVCASVLEVTLDNTNGSSGHKTRATATVSTTLIDNDSTPLFHVIPNEDLTFIGTDDSIGYYHNLAIINMHKEHPVLDSMSVSDVIESSSKSLAPLYQENADSLKEAVLLDGDYLNNVKLVQDQTTDEDDVSVYFEKWKELYPEKSGELSVLQNFFEGLSNLDVEGNNGDYMNKVLKIITDSSLPDEMKRNLSNAIIVGNASHQLWKVEE